MTDDQKKTSPEDEYQFPQDEYITSDTDENASHAQSEETESDVVQNKKSGVSGVISNVFAHPIFRNRRVLIVIGVVIVVLVFVRILDVETRTQPASMPQPVVQQQPVVTQAPSNNSAMLGSLDALRAHSSRTEDQISDLRSQVSSLQSAIAQSQSDNQKLQQGLAALQNQIQSLSGEVQSMQSRIPKGKRIVYHLRAVLPDRAWVTTGNGQTLTVTVGDHIPQYGKVQSIDSRQGIIETTSGRKIQYGPNDY